MTTNTSSPPQPLERRLPPSTRHPDGLRRCGRWDIRDGVFWQCKRAARKGYANCGVHGAGYPKREALGVRQSPARAAIKTGQYAKPETVEQLRTWNRSLEELYQFHLTSESLYDFRPVLAQARAFLELIREYAMRNPGRTADEAIRQAQRAIEAAEALIRMGDKLASIEERLGPVTSSEVRRLIEAVALTLKNFVPTHRIDEAEDYLRRLVSQPDIPVAVAAQRAPD